jgi:hypothetical protein
MGTLHYGLRGSESNDDGTFTEEEMNVVAGLGLGFLSGATGVSHIGEGEKGYTAPWVVSPEEAQARFEVFKILDPQAWDELKSHGEAAECFDRLLDIDFLQNLEKKEWSTNWGNWSTAEFVYKMGYKFGFERIGDFKQGYFREYIPIHSEHRWQQEGIEKTMRTIALLNVKIAELESSMIENIEADSEVEDWFNEMQVQAWQFLSRRVGPTSMKKNHSTMSHSDEIALYYGIYDVKIIDDGCLLTFEKQPEEEDN